MFMQGIFCLLKTNQYSYLKFMDQWNMNGLIIFSILCTGGGGGGGVGNFLSSSSSISNIFFYLFYILGWSILLPILNVCKSKFELLAMTILFSQPTS